MPNTIRPHQILSELLRRNAPARPLFVPLVFSMAARIENLALPAFLTNPTKISNALRQIRGPLRSEGVTCYFDPMLEIDALGARESMQAQSATELAPPEEVVKRGRVPIAIDVIRRMKGLVREESLLVAAVSGSATFAARAKLGESDRDYAVSTVTEIAKVFAEAGVNLIFIREEASFVPYGAKIAAWKSMLMPMFNIIRFYEALPVLQIAASDLPAELEPAVAEALLNSVEDFIVCLPLAVLQNISVDARDGINLGISLPIEAFAARAAGANDFDQILEEAIQKFRPSIVTSATDLPMATDPKRVAALAEIVRNPR